MFRKDRGEKGLDRSRRNRKLEYKAVNGFSLLPTVPRSVAPTHHVVAPQVVRLVPHVVLHLEVVVLAQQPQELHQSRQAGHLLLLANSPKYQRAGGFERWKIYSTEWRVVKKKRAGGAII